MRTFKILVLTTLAFTQTSFAFDRWDGFERQMYQNERELRDSQYQIDRNEEQGRRALDDSHRRFDRFMQDY